MVFFTVYLIHTVSCCMTAPISDDSGHHVGLPLGVPTFLVEIVVWRRLQSMLSLIMLTSKNIYVLINFVCFAESVFVTLSVVSLFVLRRSRPNMHRPIKVCNTS